MTLAQRLYEGVELGEEGSVALITYMRTDSVHVSNDALAQVREHDSGSTYGASYLPEKPNFYKSKKDAQEAHEAIRPTDVSRTPEDVKQYLRRRYVQAVPDDLAEVRGFADGAGGFRPDHHRHRSRRVHIPRHRFGDRNSTATWRSIRSVKDEEEKEDEGERDSRTLPRVTEGEKLRLEKIRPDQHFTEPPPRYTEATLVKELEEKGIGRPSTYASIISTIVEREYVNKDQGRFTPTMLGERVSDLLVKSVRGYFRRGFHRAPGRRAGRNRGRQADLAQSGEGILGPIRSRSG